MSTSSILQVLKLPSTKVIVAPMVDQSELAFRVLARRYGAGVCYTPMLHSRLFSQDPKYRREKFSTTPEDRPLVVQFCGNDPDTILSAAKLVEGQCDAVDLNLGCPQGIARKGRYGSFLLEEFDLLHKIVKTLHENLSVPVTCKIRLLPDMDATMKLCHTLQDAGCQLLTVHGRTRFQNKHTVGTCDWDKIKQIKDALDIPVVANGGVSTLQELHECMERTGVDGVMSSEAVLENPALFNPTGHMPSPIALAREYLDICREINEFHPKVITAHFFKFLFTVLRNHTDMRQELAKKKRSLEEYYDFLDRLEAPHKTESPCTNKECISFSQPGGWYVRYWKKINPEGWAKLTGADAQPESDTPQPQSQPQDDVASAAKKPKTASA